MKKVIFTSLLFFCLFKTTIAQRYFFKNYGVDEGIISGEIYDIIQASDNTLWMATFKGLSNFDGEKFTNYTKEDGLCSNNLRTVFEDSKGRIWVGSWVEKLSYIENGKIITPTNELLNKFPRIIQFYETKDHTIWIFTTRAILTFKDQTFKLVHKSTDKNAYAYPNDVVQTADGTIWVTSLKNGIIKIKTNPFKIEVINNKTHNINNICYALYKDKNDILWIGSYGVLYKFNHVNNTIIDYKIENESRIKSIIADKKGTLWLSLYGNGFASFKNEKFNIINSKNGLIDNYLTALIIDNENNKWMASQGNGIIKIKDFAFKYYTKTEGLPSNTINGIVKKNDSTITLATEKGIVSFSNNHFFNRILPSEYVNVISYDKQHKLWCATSKKYGLVNKTLNTNLGGDLFYDILVTDANEKYFIGDKNIIKIKNKISKKYNYNSLNSRTLTSIKDRILIGGFHGVSEFHNDTLKLLDHIPKEFIYIESSIATSKNEVLMGSADYLTYIKLNNENYTTKTFLKRQFNNVRGFNTLLLDGNDLWIGSSNAISKVDYHQLIMKDSIAIEIYDYNLGFIEGEAKALIKLKDKLFIGTNVGLVEFSPNQLNISSIAPKLRLNSVKLFSETLEESLYVKNNLRSLPYNKNHLTFNFSAVSLTYPENIRYKYRLKGLRDDKWSKPSKKNTVVFSYLPAGDYEFEFTADNGFGIWQKQTNTYQFKINLPFWKTDWFKFFMTSSILLIGFLIIFYKQRKKKKAQKKLITALLFAQESERKRISKELHDGIGQKLLLIKNSLKLDIKKTPNLVDSTLEDLRAVSRNLHPFQLEKLGLTKAIINLVEEVNEFSEVFFSEEIDDIDHIFSKDKEIYLYRIIQECINNIMKHSKATAAKITIKNEEKKVVITIQDNGIGFDYDKNKNDIKTLGLKSLVERVNFLKGKIYFDSPSNKGTVITIISYK
jgi:ligand-binding sensor domain-containing protein/two-component sensor histidine kinase